MSKISFNRPFIAGNELDYIKEAVESRHISGDGIFTKRCQQFMEEKFSAGKTLLVNSCTAALEMAAILCDLKKGDEVILPSYTFVSTANAFYTRGVKPVFVDIDSQTLNIDTERIDEAVTDKTRAIVPVHYAGVSCDMEKIMQIAEKYNLYVIEDAAQGVNAQYKERFLGTIGDIGTYSFHETKNYICGEGGAIVLNNNKFIERAEIIREKGTDRSKFFRGEIGKYTWVDVGSSYLPSDILAAYLYAQLENIDKITYSRNKAYNLYKEELSELESTGKVRLPYIPEYASANSQIFYLILPTNDKRNEFIDYMKEQQIQCVFHYLPLHTSPIGKKFGYNIGDLPVTEYISECLVRLPLYYEISEEDQRRVIKNIYNFFS